MAVLWRVGLFFVVFGVSSAIFIIPFADQLPRWQQELPVRFLLFTGAAAACSLLLGTWVMTRFVDRRPFRSIGLETGKAL